MDNLIKTQIETMFQQEPKSLPLLRQTKYSNWDRAPFESDAWIFMGVQNESEDITSDLFDSMDANISDKEYSGKICWRLKNVMPLNYGDIGAEALNRKFCKVLTTKPVLRQWLKPNPELSDKENASERAQFAEDWEKSLPAEHEVTQPAGQMDRLIFEDCSYSNGAIRVPQPTQPGSVSIPTQYRVENISKFASVTLRQANVLSRVYCELGLQFKDVIKINKAIRRRKTEKPWDIKINKEGLTLLQCAKELKAIRIADQEAPNWIHYDDGIFSFKIIDDLAAHDIDVLDLSEEVDPLANQPGEYTYLNVGNIKLSESAKGHKTFRQFRKAIQAIWNKSVSRKKLPALQKYAKRFTFAQRKELAQAIRQQYA